MNSELENTPISTDDPLAEKYLSLTEKYRRLQLHSEQLKNEVEFAVRHLKTMESGDKTLRSLIVARFEKILQEAPPPASHLYDEL